jgi:AbrB family looped-hinge helix DNA binding protein
MTYKVGPKGQVVLPKVLRDQLAIVPGDEVVLERDGAGIRVQKSVSGNELWASLPETDVNPLDELAGSRRLDRATDDRRFTGLDP